MARLLSFGLDCRELWFFGQHAHGSPLFGREGVGIMCFLNGTPSPSSFPSSVFNFSFCYVWRKSLISKIPSYGFYPSICTFISSFLSNRAIAAVVDSQCSSPKPINSGVPQGSVVSPTLFILFISDLNLTQCLIHSYATVDSTLHFSTNFARRPTRQELNNSERCHSTLNF